MLEIATIASVAKQCILEYHYAVLNLNSKNVQDHVFYFLMAADQDRFDWTRLFIGLSPPKLTTIAC